MYFIATEGECKPGKPSDYNSIKAESAAFLNLQIFKKAEKRWHHQDEFTRWVLKDHNTDNVEILRF